MCSVVISDCDIQFVTHRVTAESLYPAGVTEITKFELPKLGAPVSSNWTPYPAGH